MARALICDTCGKSFPATTNESTTGRWNAKIVGETVKEDLRIVWGVFRVDHEQAHQERGGRSLDVCETCARTLMEGKVPSKA